MARVGAAWDDWRASGRDAVWVTHAGVMRAALLLSRGVRLPASAVPAARRSPRTAAPAANPLGGRNAYG